MHQRSDGEQQQRTTKQTSSARFNDTGSWSPVNSQHIVNLLTIFIFNELSVHPFTPKWAVKGVTHWDQLRAWASWKIKAAAKANANQNHSTSIKRSTTNTRQRHHKTEKARKGQRGRGSGWVCMWVSVHLPPRRGWERCRSCLPACLPPSSHPLVWLQSVSRPGRREHMIEANTWHMLSFQNPSG